MVNDPTRPVGAVFYEAPTIAELDAQLAARSLEEAIHRARYIHSEPGPMDRSDAEYADRIAGAVRKWLAVQPVDPIPMVLHCPACGVQHIDEPSEGWDNPPHRSHKCGGCGIIWRVADVPTVGVPESALKTSSAADTWPIVKELSERDDELAPSMRDEGDLMERRPLAEGLECEPPIMEPSYCVHAETKPGPRIPLAYGSSATLVCLGCGFWRQDRPGVTNGPWLEPHELVERLEAGDDQ